MYCLTFDGHEDLAGLGLAGDPRREHDVAAHELIGVGDHEAGVKADPERQRPLAARRRTGERALELDRRVQPAVRAVERREEAV